MDFAEMVHNPAEAQNSTEPFNATIPIFNLVSLPRIHQTNEVDKERVLVLDLPVQLC